MAGAYGSVAGLALARFVRLAAYGLVAMPLLALLAAPLALMRVARRFMKSRGRGAGSVVAAVAPVTPTPAQGPNP
jgi:uncharacterized protein YqgC (DUF456 family)